MVVAAASAPSPLGSFRRVDLDTRAPRRNTIGTPKAPEPQSPRAPEPPKSSSARPSLARRDSPRDAALTFVDSVPRRLTQGKPVTGSASRNIVGASFCPPGRAPRRQRTGCSVPLRPDRDAEGSQRSTSGSHEMRRVRTAPTQSSVLGRRTQGDASWTRDAREARRARTAPTQVKRVDSCSSDMTGRKSSKCTSSSPSVTGVTIASSSSSLKVRGFDSLHDGEHRGSGHIRWTPDVAWSLPSSPDDDHACFRSASEKSLPSSSWTCSTGTTRRISQIETEFEEMYELPRRSPRTDPEIEDLFDAAIKKSEGLIEHFMLLDIEGAGASTSYTPSSATQLDWCFDSDSSVISPVESRRR